MPSLLLLNIDGKPLFKHLRSVRLSAQEDTRSPVRALADGVLRRVADLGLERPCINSNINDNT